MKSSRLPGGNACLHMSLFLACETEQEVSYVAQI
jgi:hypothetical protein